MACLFPPSPGTKGLARTSMASSSMASTSMVKVTRGKDSRSFICLVVSGSVMRIHSTVLGVSTVGISCRYLLSVAHVWPDGQAKLPAIISH